MPQALCSIEKVRLIHKNHICLKTLSRHLSNTDHYFAYYNYCNHPDPHLKSIELLKWAYSANPYTDKANAGVTYPEIPISKI